MNNIPVHLCTAQRNFLSSRPLPENAVALTLQPEPSSMQESFILEPCGGYWVHIRTLDGAHIVSTVSGRAEIAYPGAPLGESAQWTLNYQKNLGHTFCSRFGRFLCAHKSGKVTADSKTPNASECFRVCLVPGVTVAFRALQTGMYLNVGPQGAAATHPTRNGATLFTTVAVNKHRARSAFCAVGGRFLGEYYGKVRAHRTVIKKEEMWSVDVYGDGRIVLVANNGHYVHVEANGGVGARRTGVKDEDCTWVIEYVAPEHKSTSHTREEYSTLDMSNSTNQLYPTLNMDI